MSSPFAIADTGRSLWGQQNKTNTQSFNVQNQNRDNVVNERKKMQEEIDSHSLARADLQKQVWHLKKKIQKSEQQNNQLQATIKALQKTNSIIESRAITPSPAPQKNEYISLSLQINKILFLQIASYHQLESSIQRQYQQDFEQLFEFVDRPNYAIEKLNQILYHIELHSKATTPKQTLQNSSSSIEFLESPKNVNELQQKVINLKKKLYKQEKIIEKLQNNNETCSNCIQIQDQLHNSLTERDTLIGYIQTYKEQQSKFQTVLQVHQESERQLKLLLDEKTKECENEKQNRQNLESEVYSNKFSTKLGNIHNRDDYLKNLKKLSEIEEKCDQALSDCNRWEDEAKQLSLKNRDLERERDDLLQSLEQEREQCTHLKKSLQKTRTENSALNVENQKLENSYLEVQEKMKSWEQIAIELRNHFRLQVDSLFVKLKLVEDTVKILQSQVKNKMSV